MVNEQASYEWVKPIWKCKYLFQWIMWVKCFEKWYHLFKYRIQNVSSSFKLIVIHSEDLTSIERREKSKWIKIFFTELNSLFYKRNQINLLQGKLSVMKIASVIFNSQFFWDKLDDDYFFEERKDINKICFIKKIEKLKQIV